MIYASVDEKGTLTLTGHEPSDVFMLIQWEKSRKAGKAKIIISEEPKFDISKHDDLIKDFVSEIKKRKQNKSTVVEN